MSQTQKSLTLKGLCHAMRAIHQAPQARNSRTVHVMLEICQRPGVNSAQLARCVGLSQAGIRHHLRGLAERGLIILGQGDYNGHNPPMVATPTAAGLALSERMATIAA